MSSGEVASGAKPRKKSRMGYLTGAGLFVMVIAGIVVAGVVQRRDASADLAKWTLARATPAVKTVTPKLGGGPRAIALPGDVEAYYDASIHAQVSGYVKTWRKDIGAVVKKGEVLAEIDTPELDEKIVKARQELERAQAAETLATVTAQRWMTLQKSDAVSRQATDEKESDARVKKAEVGAAEANLKALKAQKAFANLIAPFDGVVTARNVDVGAYVTPNSGAVNPLYKVADVHAVRIYVHAPQAYAAALKIGTKATFTLPQTPDRVFDAEIDATSNAISKQARTLLVELMADNKDGALLPGSFADVRFMVADDNSRLRIPSSALITRNDGIEVATVEHGDTVHLRRVTIASDLGTEVEIGSGLSATDRVIDRPLDTIEDGDVVQVAGEPRLEAKRVDGHTK